MRRAKYHLVERPQHGANRAFTAATGQIPVTKTVQPKATESVGFIETKPDKFNVGVVERCRFMLVGAFFDVTVFGTFRR